MNNRERTTAVFRHEKADRLLWQPRLHYWFEVNKARGTLPGKYKSRNILEIYDDLGASPRAYHFFNDTLRVVEGEKVQLLTSENGNYICSKYVTPKGELMQVERRTEYGTARMKVEYFLKKVEDFDILAYILRNQSFEFDNDLYEEKNTMLGDRAEPTINLPWGSIQRLFIVYMGFQRGVTALWKHPKQVESLLDVFSESDDERFRLTRKTPFKIVNFGDNIDEGLCSPPLFEKYMLPYYRLRTSELHSAGKYCTSHWDGNVKRLVRYAKKTGLDGLECLPPQPLGNVTLSELKEAIEGMVLLDGIPATFFLSSTDYEYLKIFAQKLMEFFQPNMVVGISDMLPPDGDIERVRTIGEDVANFEI